VQGPDTFPLESEVLGKRVSADEVESRLQEEPDGLDVVLQRARGEPEVGSVEEGEERGSFLENLEELVPLGLGGVDAGGVVSARLEQHGTVFGQRLQVLEHVLEVQLDVECVLLALLGNFLIHVGEHLLVVGPGGVADGDLLDATGLEEHFASQLECPTAGESLHRDDASGVLGVELSEEKFG